MYAADRSPFWRERLAGRDLANFTESDLPSLPIFGTEGVSPQNASGAFGSCWCMPQIARRSGANDWLATISRTSPRPTSPLPILTKTEMMTEFDRIVTVPGFTHARSNNTSIR